MRLTLVLLVVLLFPASALAHVTVLPESSRPGETTDLTFRVPNERDDAATVQVDVFLPKGVPAKVSSPDGWTQVTLPTGEVRWTADEGTSIKPGRAEDFKVRLGPLPEEPRIVFKALQHYADGQIVRWIQDPSDEQRPAAVLDLGGRATPIDGIEPEPEEPSSNPVIVVGAVVAVIAILGLVVLFLRRRE
jgi:uncharacterized protein YcnI